MPDVPAGTEYVVVQPQIVGNPASGYENVYYPARERHPTRNKAIAAGWRQHGHDDWLIALIHERHVIGVAWMHEDRDESEVDERVAIAEALGIEARV